MQRDSMIKTMAALIVLIVIATVYFTTKGPDDGNRDGSGTESAVIASSPEQPVSTGIAGTGGAVKGARGGIRSPIELRLTLLAANEFEGEGAGGEVVVGIDLKPLIEAPDMKWFVQVPEELTTISGTSSWEGRMEKGEEKSFQMTLSVPDGKRYELYSRAEVYLDNGDVVTKGAGLRIDLGPEDTGPYPPFERVDDQGRRVVTFKGEFGEGGDR